MIDNRIVGKTIATLRQGKGMTQQQLAAAMNVSHQAVSKWENGAALPDIQTLVELTQLFGVTVEQLLNGELPEEQPEDVPLQERPLQSIGNFVNGVIGDLEGLFKGSGKPQAEPQPEEAEEDGSEAGTDSAVDIQKLLQMAPFMSKGAVEEMLSKSGKKLTAAEIARFAPFVESAYLERLIAESETEISWDTLRRLAPFLKKEVVDAFARTIALGEKYVRPATEEVNRTAEDVCRTLDGVSRRIGKGVDKAVRKVVRFGENVVTEVSKAFDDSGTESASREERLARLRRNAFERAIQDGKWDWIEAHLDEVRDDALKAWIAECACQQGMQDWVYQHMCDYADRATAERAIEDGDWSWLTAHIDLLDAELQQRAAEAALYAENWTWLRENLDRLELGSHAAAIAGAARLADEKQLAIQLARFGMTNEEAQTLALDALCEGDFEYWEMCRDLLSPKTWYEGCELLARAGDWESTKRYAKFLDSDGVEGLMEIAIEAGEFDAIDVLDALLKDASPDQGATT